MLEDCPKPDCDNGEAMNSATLTLDLKLSLYQKCIGLLDQRIKFAMENIDKVQAAANLETKSSAGDKYETGRAMMHIESEKYGFQLKEAQKAKKILDQINPNLKSSKIQLGSVASTNQGNYYFGVGLGDIIEGKNTYITLSLSSPLGKTFLHKQIGDDFEFRGKRFNVHSLI